MKTIRLWRGVSRTDGTYSRVIEDGVYEATVVDRLFYRVEGDDIRIRVGGGEWVAPIIKTTRETIKIFLDAGELVKVSDL